MPDWSPESESTTPPTVFVEAATPQHIALTLVDGDDRTPSDAVCVAASIAGRIIARNTFPRELWEQLLAPLTAAGCAGPITLALHAREEAPGIQGLLYALLPVDRLGEFVELEQLSSSDADDEPWRASVPSYEDALGDANAARPTAFGHCLGAIVRFAAKRRHPNDLAAEADDLLATVIRGQTVEPVEHALETLLGG